MNANYSLIKLNTNKSMFFENSASKRKIKESEDKR